MGIIPRLARSERSPLELVMLPSYLISPSSSPPSPGRRESHSRASQLYHCFCASVCTARVRGRSDLVVTPQFSACPRVLVAALLFPETLSHTHSPDWSPVLGDPSPSVFKCWNYRCEPLFMVPLVLLHKSPSSDRYHRDSKLFFLNAVH